MSNKKNSVIEELTPEMEAAIPTYINKWIKIGTNTDRLDYDRTLDIVNDVQEHLLARPRTPVVIFDNPVEAWIACNYAYTHKVKVNDLHKKVDEYFNGKTIPLVPFTMPHLTGSFDVSIFSFYDFFRTELNVNLGEENEIYNKRYDIWQATTELGLIFPLMDMCIVSQKPTKIGLNEENLAHCDGGPAIAYAGRADGPQGKDGLKLFILNNTRVPEWLATTPSHEIPIERYKEIENADVKMEFVRKVGVERMLDMGSKVDDYTKYKTEQWWKKSQYELWDMHALYPGVRYAPHLKMLNQTTGVWHVHAVAPTCRTLKDALKFYFDDKEVDLKGIA